MKSSTMVLSNSLFEDTKAIIQRFFLQKLMTAIKINSLGNGRLENGFIQDLITTICECTFTTFQYIVNKIQNQSLSTESNHISNLEFLPSVLYSLKTPKSVWSFHFFFKPFAQICDFFNIQDVNDREKCLCRAVTSITSTELLQVLGLVKQSLSGTALYYCIGLDGCVRTTYLNSALLRSNSDWDIENGNYMSPYSVV